MTPPRTPPGAGRGGSATPRSRQGGRPARSTGRSKESRAARPVPRSRTLESPRPAAPGRAATARRPVAAKTTAKGRPSPRAHATGGGGPRRPKGPTSRWSQRPGRPQRLVPPHRRMRTLLVAVAFVLSIFAAQLVRIQGFDASAVAAEARKQRTATVAIPALRGQILSSDGVVLAASQERITVVADLTAICTYQTKKNKCDDASSGQAVGKAAAALAPLLKPCSVGRRFRECRRLRDAPVHAPRGPAASASDSSR